MHRVWLQCGKEESNALFHCSSADQSYGLSFQFGLHYFRRPHSSSAPRRKLQEPVCQRVGMMLSDRAPDFFKSGRVFNLDVAQRGRPTGDHDDRGRRIIR
jgi:hypothetical protein